MRYLVIPGKFDIVLQICIGNVNVSVRTSKTKKKGKVIPKQDNGNLKTKVLLLYRYKPEWKKGNYTNTV